MKLTPIALWRSCSSPRPGAASGTRSHFSTSGLPCWWNTIALENSDRMPVDFTGSPAAPARFLARPPWRPVRRPLQRGVIGLAGADADHTIDLGDEYLAVTDLAGLGGLEHRFHHLVDQLGAHGDLDPRLRHEINDVFGPAVEFRVAALPTEALDLGHGHARYADLRQCGTDIIELEGFDDRGNQFHTSAPASILVGSAITATRRCTFHATVGRPNPAAAVPFRHQIGAAPASLRPPIVRAAV